MYLFVISVALFATLVIEATSYEEIPSRRFFSRQDDQCPCFPQGQSLIPELSNPQAHGLERVVVYIYRNIANPSQVYVFKPGPKSQKLVPNIPYLHGDSFVTVTTETIVSLFNNNNPTNVVSPQPSINNQGEPIGLNVGVIDVKLDNNKPFGFDELDQTINTNTQIPYDTGYEPNSNKYHWELNIPSQTPHIHWYPNLQVNEYSQNKQIPKENFRLPNLQIQHITNTNGVTDNWPPKEIHFNIPLNPIQYKPIAQSVPSNNVRYKPNTQLVPLSPHQYKPISQSVPLYPYQYKEFMPSVPSNNLQLKPIIQSGPTDTSQYKPITQPIPLNPSQYEQFTPSVPSNNFQYEQIIQSDPTNIFQYKPNTQFVPLNPYQYKEITQSVPSNTFQYKPYSQSVNWFQPGMIYQRPAHIHQHNTYAAGDHGHKEFSTFDMWFKGQVENFKDAKVSESVRATDTNMLRSLVRQTLSDNHIHIGHSGTLIDGNGRPIDLNNLELRPILIGSPVRLQALTQNLAIPKTLPYLEAMVMLLINPFKILGIIPLGKTYIASSGKTTHSLQFTGPQVYSHANFNGNRRSFSKLPFFANFGIKTSTTPPPKQYVKPKPLASLFTKPSNTFLGFNLPDILDLKLDSSNSPIFSNTRSPLSFNEQLIMNLKNSPFSELYGANRRLSPHLNPQVLNSKGPLLRPSFVIPQDPYSGTVNTLQLNLNPIGSPLPPPNVSPLINNEAYSPTQLIVKPANPQISNTNNLNIMSTPVINRSSNSLWQKYPSDNPSNLRTPDISTVHLAGSPKPWSTQEYTSDLSGPPENKGAGDSIPWSAMSSPELGHYDTAAPQAQEQSSWTDAIINTLPAVLNPETSGFDITQWNNLVGAQNDGPEDAQSMGSTRRFSTPLFKGVLRTLFKMFMQNMADKQRLLGHRRKIDETKESDAKVEALVGNPSKAAPIESDVGGGPDFRIIGGSAATGSGSPLSNKGRSGLG